MIEVFRAMLLFALVGLAEIGGGWLMWQWLKVDRPWPLGLLGALVIVSCWVLTWIYVRWANTRYDPEIERLRGHL